MKRQTKLTSQEQEQLAEVKSEQTTTREFGSVEELMRHDAGQTVVHGVGVELGQPGVQGIDVAGGEAFGSEFRAPGPDL